MKSRISITNVNNIDYEKMSVIDYTHVSEHTYDSDVDLLIFENQVTGNTREDNLMNVSVYNDLIVKGEEKFKILHMLSKNAFHVARFDEKDKFYF